jgi:hypothetical protein
MRGRRTTTSFGGNGKTKRRVPYQKRETLVLSFFIHDGSTNGKKIVTLHHDRRRRPFPQRVALQSAIPALQAGTGVPRLRAQTGPGPHHRGRRHGAHRGAAASASSAATATWHRAGQRKVWVRNVRLQDRVFLAHRPPSGARVGIAVWRELARCCAHFGAPRGVHRALGDRCKVRSFRRGGGARTIG